tara:strand:+ start:76 stop:657 length:582 start_codon:yes stop_codon:yes gene_type:complete
LKEYKLPKSTFIGAWFIEKKLCDDIISYFKKAPSNLKYDGLTGNRELNKLHKDSTDINIKNSEMTYPFMDYQKQLSKCLSSYIKKFKEVETLSKFNLDERGYNIQKYKIGGGFKIWHCERNNLNQCSRILVFMTYLNNVKDGGTFFKYQNIKIPAKKGLTLIWPSDWTHTHKGEISETKEKFIVTGWLSFLKE